MEHNERIRTYFLRASLEELHQNSRSWLSELAFWKDEFAFMKNLLIMNFAHFIEEDKNLAIDKLTDRILDLSEIEFKNLDQRIVNHEKHLAEILEDPTSHHESIFRREHARLEGEIELLKQEIRMLKSEIFRIGELVLKADKPLKMSRVK